MGLLTVCSGAVLACGDPVASPARVSRETTDVLWLTICTLRADHLGAYGYPEPVSPRIDRLAESGFLFERTLTQAPWTRPSIASMVTSVYPRRLGIDDSTRWPSDRALNEGFETAAEYFRDAGYYTIGITTNPNTNATFHFDQGYDHYEGTERLWRTGYAEHKVDADQVVGRFLEQLRGPAKDKKVFAHLVLTDTHAPYRERGEAVEGASEPSKRRMRRYDEQIRFVDGVVHDLVETLHRIGRSDTLIVINSDHGEGFREAGPLDHGHGEHLFNSVLWVPFILHHPAFAADARRISARVENVDVLPTVLELLGIPFEADGLDGRSHARALVERTTVDSKASSIVETGYELVDRSAILRDGWKLIVDAAADREAGRGAAPERQLFRYRDDPLEGSNLTMKQAELTEALFLELTRWQAEFTQRAPEEALHVEVSEHEREALRALGYVEQAEGR